ncbi:adenylyl-sulfate kinase [Cohnella suwonensis]|uniref:Adenylyl-sulfate kinase n=1 Tax=Cohnella suwonensis TaxID=696072 RepID=A0ABW0LXR2_9BACL
MIATTGTVCWIVGLSGSGKSTIARIVEERLRADGVRAQVLDGDEIRGEISAGLGFSYGDRMTHVRRVAEPIGPARSPGIGSSAKSRSRLSLSYRNEKFKIEVTV